MVEEEMELWERVMGNWEQFHQYNLVTQSRWDLFTEFVALQ
jgi:hypothetical protein